MGLFKEKKRKIGAKGVLFSLVALAFLVFFDVDVNDKNVNMAKDVYESAKSIILSMMNESEAQVAVVSRVVDGDTLVVTLNGKEEKVRLIGVNTPESVGRFAKNPQPFGKEASAYTKEQLDGKTVYLQKDVSDKDKYGRLLRYVWLEEPKASELKTKMFNAILIIEGYGNVMTYPPDVKHSKTFTQLEKEAREADKGLWKLKKDE